MLQNTLDSARRGAVKLLTRCAEGPKIMRAYGFGSLEEALRYEQRRPERLADAFSLAHLSIVEVLEAVPPTDRPEHYEELIRAARAA